MTLFQNFDIKKFSPFILPILAIFLIVNANISKDKKIKQLKILPGPSGSIVPPGDKWSFLHQECEYMNDNRLYICEPGKDDKDATLIQWVWIRTYPRENHLAFADVYINSKRYPNAYMSWSYTFDCIQKQSRATVTFIEEGGRTKSYPWSDFNRNSSVDLYSKVACKHF